MKGILKLVHDLDKVGIHPGLLFSPRVDGEGKELLSSGKREELVVVVPALN